MKEEFLKLEETPPKYKLQLKGKGDGLAGTGPLLVPTCLSKLENPIKKEM